MDKPGTRRDDPPLSIALTPFYDFARRCFCLLRPLLLTGWKVTGVENIPANGPAILASNHISYLDPTLIISFIPRQIFFVSKAEMFDSRIADWFFRRMKVFPIRRGTADVEALRHAIEILKRGDLVGLFPRGTRAAGSESLPAQPGVVLLASRGKVPIIPVALTGMQRVMMPRFPFIGRPRVTLTIGKQFRLDELTDEPVTAENRQALADKIIGRVEALLPANR